MLGLLVAIGGGVLLVVLLVIYILSRIKVAGPNEAFIVTGRKGRAIAGANGVIATDLSGQKVVMGASVFVLPVVQRLQVMGLSSRRIHVEIQGAVSKQGIRANLQGVAIVKVGGTEDAIRAAAQRFLGQQNEIEEFTREVLAGALRSIVGRLTIEEIIRDRTAFASAVAEEAEHSMTNQGLVLDTFQLQDILAEGTYLQDLGRPEAARVARDAAIAEARARQEAEQERLRAEESIAQANRNLAVKQASVQAEIDTARAQSAAAGPLAEAERQQGILAEQQKVAERNAELKQRQLDTEVRKPADADRYRVEQEAEARKAATIADAEAKKAATIAAAEALEREGSAEAAAILAKGNAEAAAMQSKADAFGAYGEAAVLDLLLKVLPELVGAAAAPVGAIDKLTVISTDGASSLTKTVAANVAQGLQVGTDLTGIDLTQLLSRLSGMAGKSATDEPAAGNGGRRPRAVTARPAPKQASTNPEANPETAPE